MKICYLAEPLSVHTQKWIEYFSGKGYEICLVSLIPRELDFPGTEIFYLNRPYHPVLEKIDYLLSLKKLRRLLKDINPDILHTHFVTKWGWLAALSGFHPLILTCWGSDLFIDADKSAYHRFLTRLALRKADLVTANSYWLRRRACNLGADPEDTYVIQFGINLKRFQKVECDSLAERLKIPKDAPVVFSPRLMQPVYNIETVVKVIPAVLIQKPETVFVVVNYPQNNYSDKIRKIIEEAGVEKQVRLVDRIPHHEMPEYYSLADVTLSIAVSDSAALSVLEAMACGSVPVVSNLPALREIISESESGYRVSPHHHSEISGKIIDIIHDREHSQKISLNNRKKVTEIADQMYWMRKMDRLYKKILTKNAAG